MSWKLYEIDRCAHDLVLKFRDKDVLSESHKMRVTATYGLERFWGEHIRLQRESQDKSKFWKATWTTLCDVMKEAGVTIPNSHVQENDTATLKAMTDQLWEFDIEHRKVALSILIELCDSLVWWTQRYKKSGRNGGN